MTTQDTDADFTFKEWCEAHHFSESTGHKILNGENPPRVMRPTANVLRITREADREWSAAEQAATASKAGKLEDARRKKYFSALGKRAVASPKHIWRVRAAKAAARSARAQAR